MEIAEEGSEKIYTPSWTEIEIMKQRCLPKVAFKLESTNSEYNLVEYYHLSEERNLDIKKLSCPNQSEESVQRIKNMKRYLPIDIAMLIYQNPTPENKLLKEYVERYVRKLNF
ncbi:hypothetical protein EI981_13700 [Paenibacillus lutimineralis]|uniref:Uncharacterized protein n=1 Tax=Paenibacillus lutimineralis TaxID=2707005 RepID=A0A3S9UYK7_9BACL|nr:hypothetical protein EI981_13700 [Paenibacillus lutimineralis]